MDKNNIIGIVLIFVLLAGYMMLTQPSEEEQLAIQKRNDSLRQAQIEMLRQDSITKAELELTKNIEDTTTVTSNVIITEDDTLIDSKLTANFGIFAKAGKGEEKFISLYNKNVKINFSTKGAYPYYGELLEFKAYDKSPLILFDNEDNKVWLNLYIDNKAIKTTDLYFDVVSGDSIFNAESSTQTVKFRLYAGSTSKYLEYVYTLAPDSYEVTYDINFVGLSENIAANASYIDMVWDTKLKRQEKGADWENQKTTVYFKYLNDEVDYLTETSDDDSEELESRVKWIANKGHFFSSVLIAKDFMKSASVSFVADELQEKYLKTTHSVISLPFDNKSEENYNFTIYYGPNDYDILTEVHVNEDEDLELKRMIPLGWVLFRWVNQYAIIPLFNVLDHTGLNYGIIILLMTLIIKSILFPLTYKSFSSSAKMRVLKPQIEEINKKIPKDKSVERQKATMTLYKKVGVNPMGGCLPMVLQFPILIAMYMFFPSSIELRQESFLWADDLSAYDSIWDFPGGFEIPFYGDHVSLFTLLMAVAILISTHLNNTQMSGAQAQMPGMKVMMYMMPVMMLFWFNNYSAGLSYYYLVSNVITILQTLIIRKMINEDDLLLKLNSHKKKVVKKSKFQERLDLMAKEKAKKKK